MSGKKMILELGFKLSLIPVASLNQTKDQTLT